MEMKSLCENPQNNNDNSNWSIFSTSNAQNIKSS
jgi:hypothetical protein